jgi:anti-sigma factor RsiW
MNRPARECALVAPMLEARDGELSAEERALRAVHLEGCHGCRARQADLEATEGLVREALLAEAARRDFAPFVDGVMERVEAAERRRRGVLGGVLGWARRHRAAAAATALAPTLAAIALIMYVASPGTPAPFAVVEVVAEGTAPMVLQTSEGPVVLLGDDDPSGT